MENMFEEVIAKAKLYPENKIKSIDLGCMNGWGEERYNLLKELRKFKITEGEKETKLGNCYYNYTFTINVEDTPYDVSYSVDSSD